MHGVVVATTNRPLEMTQSSGAKVSSVLIYAHLSRASIQTEAFTRK